MSNVSSATTFFARACMALIFLVSGIRKLMMWGATVGYFTTLGLPFPHIVVPLTIAVEIGGAIALLAGWNLRVVAVVLAGFTLATALTAHQFWTFGDAQFGNQLNHFLKNIAMVGGFLVVAVNARRAPSAKQNSQA